MNFSPMILALLCVAGPLFAADSSAVPAASQAAARLFPDSLSLGDPVALTLTLTVPRGAAASLLEEHPDLGAFSVIDARQKRQNGAAFDTLLWNLSVTSYDQTRDTIPAVGFSVVRSDSLVDTVYTQAIVARIASVLPKALPADSLRLREIRPPFAAGKYPWHLWLGIPLAGLLGWLFWRWLKGRKKTPAELAAETPPIPPWEEAIAAIAALDASDLLGTGRTREYVFTLSDILKRYLGRRFETNAAEWTTDELVDWIRSSNLPSAATAASEAFLTESHLVKFAKVVPDAIAAKALREKTLAAIEQTKPLPGAVTDAPNPTAGASA